MPNCDVMQFTDLLNSTHKIRKGPFCYLKKEPVLHILNNPLESQIKVRSYDLGVFWDTLLDRHLVALAVKERPNLKDTSYA